MMKPFFASIAILAAVAGCSKPSKSFPMASPIKVAVQSNTKALYPISVEGKWGFIDASGKVVVEPQFLSVERYSEGLARVTVPGLTDEDRLFERAASGFIDESGSFVIGPGSPSGYEFPGRSNYYSYGDFHEGLAKFWVGDATGAGGYIDRTGKLIIPPKYASADDFSDGVAHVSLPRADGSAFGPKSSGFINRNDQFVIAPNREFGALGFSEGLCIINEQNEDGKWTPSVIDLKGKNVIPPGRYTGISDFVGGLARVVKDGKEGCIDTEGRVVIPLEFDRLWEFEHNALSVGKRDGKYFIVDRQGRWITEIELAGDIDVGRLRSGFATVRSGGKVGYVNESGTLAIPMQFDRAEDFRGDLAKVELGGVEGYINRQGEFVWRTDCWDEPIRNAVVKPLADFLPPNTVESLPLEYNWQRVQNAIVFASSEPIESLEPWFRKQFGGRFRLSVSEDEEGQIAIYFYGDELMGSFHAADTNGENAEGFLSFYASKNMKLLLKLHQPRVVGILIHDR